MKTNVKTFCMATITPLFPAEKVVKCYFGQDFLFFYCIFLFFILDNLNNQMNTLKLRISFLPSLLHVTNWHSLEYLLVINKIPKRFRPSFGHQKAFV